MKKYFILIVLCTQILTAQERIHKNLGDFNSVKVFSGLQVKLIKSDVQKIEIKGFQSEAVVVKNVNGLLKLSVSLPKVFDVDGTLVNLYYTKDLDLIDVNEGAKIRSKDAINQDFIEIKAQEGAEVHLKIQTENIKVKSVSGGVIDLFGTTKLQTVIVNTGASYEALDLVSKQATVIAATGGEVEINVSDLLDAKVKLKGFIYYKSKPKKIIKKVILGGEILSIKESNSYKVYN